ncbi:MAG: hypothetical protein mread185_000510 [Mycoplasmataceae bacterium]|nr:MAG: hypothetical protein mread185_000510 [Mycoplasmataceae bacterium]
MNLSDLTKRYLESLNLQLSRQLSDNQKAEIIKINSQSGWIIFNAGSLKAKKQITERYTPMLYAYQDGTLSRIWENVDDYINRNWQRMGLADNTYELRDEVERENDNVESFNQKRVFGRLKGSRELTHLSALGEEVDRGFNPEAYEITSNPLKDLLLENIKIHYQSSENTLPSEWKANVINFTRGSGKDNYNKTIEALPIMADGQVNDIYWVAINKQAMISEGYDLDESTIIFEKGNDLSWRKSFNVKAFLNNSEIVNSRAPEIIKPLENSSPESNRQTDDNFSNDPPLQHNSASESLREEVPKVCKNINDNDYLITQAIWTGLELESFNETEFLNLVVWDRDWNDANNQEAREMADRINETYLKNKRKLTEFINKTNEELTTLLQDNDYSQLKKDVIDSIKNSLNNYGIQLENNDWEDQVNNSNNPEEINRIKDNISEIINHNQKIKVSEKILISLIQRGKNFQGNDKLLEIINEIENFYGEKIYNLHLNEIQEIKDKLFYQNSSSYSNDIYRIIIGKMKNKKVAESELSEKSNLELDKLKNQTTNDKIVVNQIQTSVIDEVNKIAVEKKLNNLLIKYQQVNEPTDKERIRKEIESFVIESGSNHFMMNAYQKQKSLVDKILEKEKNTSTQHNDRKEKQFPIITIGIIVVFFFFLLSSIVIIIKGKKR